MNELEISIVQPLLADLPPELEALRSQWNHAIVEKREFTGVGFFTSFRIPDAVDRVMSEKFQLEGFLKLQDVPDGATAILFIQNGVISVLEVVTFSGAWPARPVLLSVEPVNTNGGNRRV